MICYWKQKLSICTLLGVWGDHFHKKISKFSSKIFILFILQIIFSRDYCSKDIKRQSEHSKLRPDTSSLVFVPTFGENGIFKLGVVFFIQSIFADRNNTFQQNFFLPFWIYLLSEFKFKKIFHLQLFFVKFWWFENCQIAMFFEESIHNAESVARIIYMRVELSHTTKSFQIELRLANRSYQFRVTWILVLSKIYRFSIFFPKTFRYELRDNRNIQGLSALINEQSCYTLHNRSNWIEAANWFY